jgi:hypothetical protein
MAKYTNHIKRLTAMRYQVWTPAMHPPDSSQQWHLHLLVDAQRVASA